MDCPNCYKPLFWSNSKGMYRCIGCNFSFTLYEMALAENKVVNRVLLKKERAKQDPFNQLPTHYREK